MSENLILMLSIVTRVFPPDILFFIRSALNISCTWCRLTEVVKSVLMIWFQPWSWAPLGSGTCTWLTGQVQPYNRSHKPPFETCHTDFPATFGVNNHECGLNLVSQEALGRDHVSETNLELKFFKLHFFSSQSSSSVFPSQSSATSASALSSQPSA